MSLFAKIVAVVILLPLAGFLAQQVAAEMRRMSGSTIVSLAGLFFVFLGERVFGMGDSRFLVSGVGLVIVGVSVALRLFAFLRSEGRRKQAHKLGLAFSAVVVVALATYGLSTPAATASLDLSETLSLRWRVVFQVISAVLFTIGLLPTLLIDRLLSLHPLKVPAGAVQDVTRSGLVTALMLCLLFSGSYLSASWNKTFDLAYFRTTQPGDATRSIVETLEEPVIIEAFFAPGNEVGKEVDKYFGTLSKMSLGNVQYRRLDQAVEPLRASELELRDNGSVVLSWGDKRETISLGEELRRAKRKLRKFDGDVQNRLLKLTHPERKIYVLTGHGEAASSERTDKMRKLSLLKNDVKQFHNMAWQTLNAAETSTIEVPPDAAALLIAAPKTPLLPEEIEAIKTYWDEGGSLFILGEPGGDAMPEIMSHIGVTFGGAVLANDEFHLNQKRGKLDRWLLVTNNFGSHDTVRNVGRTSREFGLLMPSSQSVEKVDGAKGKFSPLIRTYARTYPDANKSMEHEDDEEFGTYQLAMAVSRLRGNADKDEALNQSRAVIVGDTTWLTDPVLTFQANINLSRDMVRWLIHADDIKGFTNNEEDVEIKHTRSEDAAWFYLTIVAIPTLVLAAGLVLVRRRRKQ